MEEFAALQDNSLEAATGGKAKYYTAQKGETLTTIAAHFGTTVEKLCELNGIDGSAFIPHGMRLKIR